MLLEHQLRKEDIENRIKELTLKNVALLGTIESMKQTNAALIKKCQKLIKSKSVDYSNMKAENFEYKQEIHNPHRYLPEEDA